MLGILMLSLAAASDLSQHAAPPPPTDSVSVPVAWRARGGSMDSLGLYTAGSAAGTYRVTATAGKLEASARVTVAVPVVATTTPSSPLRPASPPVGETGAGVGIPFGPFSTRYDSADDFTLYFSGQTPHGIIGRIREAQRTGKKLMLAMTGGSHRRYMTGGVFDISGGRATY